MDEQTKSPFPDSGTKDSSLFGLSSRSLIVFLICGTVCAESMVQCIASAYFAYLTKSPFNFEIKEPLYSLVIMTVGYYFGQNQKQQAK
jgi:hypothetical protein